MRYNSRNLQNFASQRKDSSKWGSNKNKSRSDQKLKKFVKYFPKIIDVCVDLGCGDGLDIMNVGLIYRVKTPICADIKDERDFKYKNNSKFLTVVPDKPLKIDDGVVDVVLMFHVIHHMVVGVFERLNDIYRIMKIGGILCIKDHDVNSKKQAENVDFQHYVYGLQEYGASPTELATNFEQYLPMTYYTCDEINEYLLSLGFVNLLINKNKNLTFTYDAIYRKE